MKQRGSIITRAVCAERLEDVDDGGYAEALERLRDALRRDADREITLAMVAVVRQEYGYKPTEIRQQLGVTAGEMRSISMRLERAAKSLRVGL